MLLGTAILSKSSSPVEAQLANQENAFIHHCLLLGEGQGHQAPRFATPPLAFRTGQLVSLHGADFRIAIRLRKLVEGSASFNIFTYEEIDLASEQESIKDETAAKIE